jgi:hypothetical protein
MGSVMVSNIDVHSRAFAERVFRNPVVVAEIRKWFAAEQEFSRVVRAGSRAGGRHPTDEAMAARQAAIDARVAESGFSRIKASKASITATGDLELYATPLDVADAKALNAKQEVVYTKDYTAVVKGPDGQDVLIEHKAGDRRNVSAVALLMRNNENAINIEASKFGLDNIEMPGRGAVVCMNVDRLLDNAVMSRWPEKMLAVLKEATAASLNNWAKLQISRANAARKLASQESAGICR